MKVAALFSGGKDSTYAARLIQERGDKLSYLVSVKPRNPESYMFHSVNLHITPLQAEAWSVPLIQVKSSGRKEEEILDLKKELSKLDIDGVVSGAIASNYQRTRIDKICNELGRKHISPLWGRERTNLMREMLDNGMKIIISAVAAYGLDDSWLGKQIDQSMLDRLDELSRKFGVDISGEGGEYESLVIDAPWFINKIDIIDAKRTWDGSSGRFIVKKARLSSKIHKD
ncbi:TIGR00289 family protein [Candidatus Bathyarchaeota archaeon]|nr:TIGR00289 family protein [Candidatus Bathyarchaeota archaeon]